MIYLAQLPLNPRSRQVQAELRNPYEMHRTLSRAFGKDSTVWQQARCLFRVEETMQTGTLRALVQSRIEPDWRLLDANSSYLQGEPQVKAFEPRLIQRQHLAFRLRANPTLCRDGKRRAIDTEEMQVAWLQRKGDLHGFTVCSVRTFGDEVVGFRTANRFDATFYSVTFNGVMRVTDGDMLRTALECGIGSGKAFGFGLLSLARI